MKNLNALILTLGMALTAASTPALAQSEASVALSLFPVASVVVAASTGAAAVAAVPAAFSVLGAVLVIKAVEVTARSTVYVLERASDGAVASIEITGRATSAVSAGVGTAVVVGIIGAGTLLSVAGEVIAFIPNELGRALLYNERITN